MSDLRKSLQLAGILNMFERFALSCHGYAVHVRNVQNFELCKLACASGNLQLARAT